MSRITQVDESDWVAFPDRHIAVLDLTTAQATERFGWTWERHDVEGIGPVLQVVLLFDGQPRYMLEIDEEDPIGISVATPEDADPWVARTDFLDALELPQHAYSSIAEGDVHYARTEPEDWWRANLKRWNGRLLADVLDALDRLFDNETTVVDLRALLAATAAAIPAGPVTSHLEAAAFGLRAHVIDNDRLAALAATDDLRRVLASLDLD